MELIAATAKPLVNHNDTRDFFRPFLRCFVALLKMQLPNVAEALRKLRLPCPGKSEPRIRDCIFFRLDEMKQLSSQTLNVFYLKTPKV